MSLQRDLNVPLTFKGNSISQSKSLLNPQSGDKWGITFVVSEKN